MLVELQGQGVRLLGQGGALPGGVCLRLVTAHFGQSGLHLGGLVVAELLHLGQLAVDQGIVLRRALIGQRIVGQGIHGPVVAVFPALGKDDVSTAPVAGERIGAIGIGRGCIGGSSFLTTKLIAIVHVGGQRGEVGDGHGVLAVLHS